MDQPWQTIDGVVVAGHQIASGQSADSPYPAGSIVLQRPHFAAGGLDLAPFFMGTINVSIAPTTFTIINATHRFEQLAWSDQIPPETFSFVNCQLTVGRQNFAGFVYYPHPETKVHHFHDASIVELIMPWIDDLNYDDAVELALLQREVKLHAG